MKGAFGVFSAFVAAGLLVAAIQPLLRRFPGYEAMSGSANHNDSKVAAISSDSDVEGGKHTNVLLKSLIEEISGLKNDIKLMQQGTSRQGIKNPAW